MFAGVAFRAWGRDQQDLVGRLKENEVIRTSAVERAFRLTDRALFVPYAFSANQRIAARAAAAARGEEAEEEGGAGGRGEHPLRMPRATPAELAAVREQAYLDAPVKIGDVHLSAPHMYALVLEKLALQPGMSFLCLGSGSGYLSSMAAVLVGSTGLSHGVEIKPGVVEHARRCTATWRRRIRRWRRAQKDEEAAMQAHAGAGVGGSATASASASAAPRAATSAEPSAAAAPATRLQPMEDIESSAGEAGKSDRPAPDTEAWDSADESDGESAMIEEQTNAAIASVANSPPAPAVAPAASGAPAAAAAPADAAPRFTNRVVQVPGVAGGPPRRGMLGVSPDLVSREGGSGDAEAARALELSVQPLMQFFNGVFPRSSEMEERQREEGVAAAAAAPAADAGQPSPAPSPSPSASPEPSPTPSMASSSGDSVHSESGGPGASWRPPFPVDLPASPQYTVGDAFDVATDERAVKYDRVYIGAALPRRFIPHFARLLHPRGKLVAPFDDAFELVSKRADGSIRVEQITQVGYAPLRLQSDEEMAQPRPRIEFSLPSMKLPEDYPTLPAAVRAPLHAILMLQARDGSTCLPGRLPLPLWTHILSFTSREWWMDRAKGEVPWSVPVAQQLERVKRLLAEGRAQAQERKWQQADHTLLDCNRALEQLKEEEAMVSQPSTPPASGDSPRSVRSDSSSGSSSSSSSLSAERISLRTQLLRLHLPVLLALSRHSRAVRMASELLQSHPRDAAVLFAKARALLLDDELPDAIDVLDKLCSCHPELAPKEQEEGKEEEKGEEREAATASADAHMSDVVSPSHAAGSPAAAASPPTGFPPSDLPAPTAASVSSLRAHIQAGMSAYQARQRSVRMSFGEFMQRILLAQGVGGAEEEEEEEEQPEDVEP